MKKTVVLADDRQVGSDGLVLLLQRCTWLQVVAVTSSGEEAVDAVVQHRPDLAILDISMPEVHSIAVAEQVNAYSPGTRVIILSTFDERSYVLQALRAGAWGYVLKDSVATKLVEAVETVLGGHRYLSPRVNDRLVEDYLAQEQEHAAVSRRRIHLNHREREILRYLAQGLPSAQIGDLLGLATNTVDTYRSRIMRKLGVYSSAGLMEYAVQNRLIAERFETDPNRNLPDES